uniref:Integrase, catalytic region, zinc finger, CCHC-type, peptidase aspartic, catalytic n=1 Tax=Tanacetum cinerariifolium TaxID=118510 RepID=A0A6L2MML8_TANCI|nr:hypothetical protein [Tanacetum cinerariifolium]
MKSLKEKVKDRLLKQDQSLQTVHMLCRPKPYYNELNKVAIGYKNPLCLTRAKQVHPSLYNGHEIIKDNNVLAIVHNTEDTLEKEKITRRKMNDKMKDPECVNHKVNIAPHDYSKEHFLDTFTPQKQLTPEQIFWSQDLIKIKTKAIQEQTTASRPIKALTVYPPNIHATLFPRVLPMKSQVKIHIFTLIQLFSEFDKTFKEHFEGIQKALTKEIKEMKDVFEELEDDVAQNVVDRKHDEIEHKNLLIVSDNLIAGCLSKEVFSIAMNSELNVARFTEMHVAHTIVKAHCLELEAELSNLHGKSHNDNHNDKDHVKPTVLAPGKYAIYVEPIPSRLRNNNDAHIDYLRHLKESVETIREIVEEAKVVRPLDSLIVSACRYTKHSQELLEYTIALIRTTLTNEIKTCSFSFIGKKQDTFAEQCDTSNSNTHKHVLKMNTQKTNVPVPPFTGVNRCIVASRSQPRSNTKKISVDPLTPADL